MSARCLKTIQKNLRSAKFVKRKKNPSFEINWVLWSKQWISSHQFQYQFIETIVTMLHEEQFVVSMRDLIGCLILQWTSHIRVQHCFISFLWFCWVMVLITISCLGCEFDRKIITGSSLIFWLKYFICHYRHRQHRLWFELIVLIFIASEVSSIDFDGRYPHDVV